MKRLKFVPIYYRETIVFYRVMNKKVQVGKIDRYWNRWVWKQESEMIMSRDCLREVVEFMEGLGGKG